MTEEAEAGRAWDPEHAVDEELAKRLIEATFPELQPARVELLGIGWDNSAFTVNGELVFRFPRREVAVELIRHECALLPALAPHLPLPIPVPTHVSEPTPDFPWPWAGYELLAGRTADRAHPDHADRERLARPLAEFLRALHSVPAELLRQRGAPTDTLRRVDVDYRRPQILERWSEAHALGCVGTPTPPARMLDDAPDDRAGVPAVPVHGDLYARHLLLDDDLLAAGVIDWGDVHLGDPAVDLALAHGFLPPSAHAIFRDAYGPIDEDT